MVRLAGRILPALAIRPGENLGAVVPGSSTVVDSVIYAMRQLGFGEVDLVGGPVVQLSGWAVWVERGRLDRITAPEGTWWVSDTALTLHDQWCGRLANSARRWSWS